MPIAPLRPCATSGCPVLVAKGHCPAHQPKPPGHVVRRMRGRKLQRARARLFSKQPLCVLCLAHGRVTVATTRDHRVNLAEGGLDIEENTQPICDDCHDAKTAEERRRGIKRWWER